MRRFSALIAAVCVAASVAPARAAYAPPVELFRIQDPWIKEASGLVPSSRSDSVLFTHNDSGDDGRFFAVGAEGAALATFDVTPPGQYPAALDWEDIAAGPGSDGTPALYLADIGDNPELRPFIAVYEVPEPSVDETQTGVTGAVTATTHLMVYEDGPHNAETLLADPRDGTLAIVTKEADGLSGVFVETRLPGGVSLMRRVATVDFNVLSATPSDPNSTLATGGDIARDRSRVVVRTYREAFEWSLGADDLAAAFARAPERITLAREGQGEAICYARDSRDLLTVSEGEHQPVWKLAAA